MRVEYTEPAPSEPDFPDDTHASRGTSTAVLDQESPSRPEDECPGADARTTVG